MKVSANKNSKVGYFWCGRRRCDLTFLVVTCLIFEYENPVARELIALQLGIACSRRHCEMSISLHDVWLYEQVQKAGHSRQDSAETCGSRYKPVRQTCNASWPAKCIICLNACSTAPSCKA